MRVVTFIAVLFIQITALVKAQSFLNPDLEDTIIGKGFSQTPWGWEKVPYTDPVCTASDSDQATADLFGIDSPSLKGNPQSGISFVSGFNGITPYIGGTENLFHEGIMQTVSGFIPGFTYTIRFYQTVVKQLNGLDQSGSWEVYMDNELVGITNPTFSAEPYNSITLPWEEREVSFLATNTVHTIKFLPIDDDDNRDASDWDITGALRMGIDNIHVDSIAVPSCDSTKYVEDDRMICDGDSVFIGGILRQEPGTYQDTLRNGYGCDSVITNVDLTFDCSEIYIPNAITPNGDGVNDIFNPSFIGKSFISYTLQVYSRFGQQFFESDDPLMGWDGKFKGTAVPLGVYVYDLRYKEEGNVGETRILGRVSVLQ